MKLKMLFVSLLSIVLSSCGSMKISDVGPMVQLPASKECFQVHVLSGKEVIYPPEECERIKQRSIIITSETWKLLRGDIQTNCQLTKCKQLTGAVDGLFYAIDKALELVL